MKTECEYEAKKSAWSAITVWQILFFWLIIPLIVMAVKIVKIKSVRISFYKDRVIERSGILSKRERQSLFQGVLSVSVEQSFSGRLFGYGNVKINVFGKWDIDTHGIVRPEELKRYLETRMIRKGEIGGTILDA